MWANGNGGEDDDDCAADGFAASIYTISVGAMSVHGPYSTYDEACSPKMTTAYVTNNNQDSNVVNFIIHICMYIHCIVNVTIVFVF